MINTQSIEWKILAFMVTYHILLFMALPLYLFFTLPSLPLMVITLILYSLTCLSITAGYHRFYAHKAYSLNKIVEVILLFFATLSMEGSALKWAYQHRLHHRFVDKEKDPYNISKGFFYAHMLWMFKKQPEVDQKVVADLVKNKLVMFQHRYYGLLAFSTNLLAFLCIGLLLNDYWGAFIFSWWGRVFLLHHTTWLINSAAHYWGEKTYSREFSAVDNFFLSLLVFGEGYHNYHHVFASDYRNGVRWYHYDPTKWLVWLLSKVGLASNLKKVDYYTIQLRLVEKDRKLFVGRLKNRGGVQHLEKKAASVSTSIKEKLLTLKKLQEQPFLAKKTKKSTKELKDLHKALSVDWSEWRGLSKKIMKI